MATLTVTAGLGLAGSIAVDADTTPTPSPTATAITVPNIMALAALKEHCNVAVQRRLATLAPTTHLSKTRRQ